MKNNVLLFLAIMLTLISCKSGVKITFVNKSQEEFKVLRSEIEGEKLKFENIESGESTKRVKVPNSYRYCYAQVITEKDTLSFIPFDYLGEKLYKRGAVKMRLKIVTEENGKRRLVFVD